MVNHWSFKGGSFDDLVGGAHMRNESGLVLFASDHRGNQNTALSLNGGFASVPPGVYFSSAFTISVWVKPRQIRKWSRIIDFGDGPNKNNVLLGLTEGESRKPLLHVYVENQYLVNVSSSTQLVEDQWQLLAATFDCSCANIYINGQRTGSANANQLNTAPRAVIRQSNYIGRSNWHHDQFSHSIISDLRFFNRCLSSEEINILMTI